MATQPRPGKYLLVISNDADRAAQAARMLGELGYDVELSQPAAILSRCRLHPPHALVVASKDEETAIQEALSEVKRLQDLGILPSFPIISAGRPDGEATMGLIDGIVLEPDRLTSLATEISKQVDGVKTPAPLPLTVDGEDA